MVSVRHIMLASDTSVSYSRARGSGDGTFTMDQKPMSVLVQICFVAAMVMGVAVDFSGSAQAQSSEESALESVRDLQSLLGSPQRGGECPPRDQAMAHKVIELHTQLMVTSLSCADIYSEPDLHAQYRVFTDVHAGLIRDSQQRIQRALGGDAAVDALDQYLAEIANDEALVIQQRSRALYCAMRNSRFHSLIDASPASFDNYAEELALRDRVRAGC